MDIGVLPEDRAWAAEWLPFLLFGETNVRMFNLHNAKSRRFYFLQMGFAVWCVHLALVASGDITLGESKAVCLVLEEYIVAHHHDKG